tara:strand:- start:424 stop:657 length:234 start_codon:yes stop_codon:yes gene_type:complete
MKEITEKQILQWKAELDSHKAKLKQAQTVVEQEIKFISMIEGGIQFGEALLRQNEQEVQPLDKEVQDQQSETAPSKK